MTLSQKSPYQIVLADSKSRTKYKLKIPQGSLQVGTISSDDTVYVRNVGKRVGDFDEQRSWKGGRGIENLSDNAAGFFDSKDAWTLSPNHVHQTLQWYHARGLRSEEMYMPTRSAGSMSWHPVLGASGNSGVVGTKLTASGSYNVLNLCIWIRRVGTPGTGTLALNSNSSGSPGSALQTVSVTTSTVSDTVSQYLKLGITSQAVTSSTDYWVVFQGDAADNADNHWEVGVDTSTSNSKVSTDGGSIYSAASFTMWARYTNADTNRKWFRFSLSNAFYIIDKKDTGAASNLYINGDRGIATSATSTTIVDSTKSWTTNRWATAYVKITAGTGAGQLPRQIVSNTSTALTVSGWTIQPDSTSEYVIYATEWFTEVTFSGATLATCSGEPKVVNDIVYIPQGTTAFIHGKWNSAGPNHLGYPDAGSYKLAHFFMDAIDPADGPVLWRANNTSATGSGGLYTVSRANLMSAGSFLAYNTNLTFKTAITTGSTSARLTGLGKHNNSIYVGREDGIGTISNDRFVEQETGINKTPDSANGLMFLAHGQFMYYSWLHSLVRIYGSTHDDIGDDYRAIGLPNGREGVYADGESYLKLDFFAVDAGNNGTSSVLAWDGLGWHEILRCKAAGDRCRFVKVQVCENTRNRLWSDSGGDLVFQELPFRKAAPRLDNGARYMHEAVVESAAIDMGTASALPKFISQLTATVQNMSRAGREVYVDYQTDENVHTSNWTYASMMTESPESNMFLGLQNIRKFAYRLRINCNNNSVPVDVTGVVPNGFARTPFRMIWTMQIQSGSIVGRRGRIASFDELTRWLLDASRQPGLVTMTSVYELAHGYNVIIHPPRMFPMTPKRGRTPETGSHTLVLQEIV